MDSFYFALQFLFIGTGEITQQLRVLIPFLVFQRSYSFQMFKIPNLPRERRGGKSDFSRQNQAYLVLIVLDVHGMDVLVLLLMLTLYGARCAIC